ncbi:hypothetical protein F5X99DRAFT_41078 [Biscogniauxia marginata]|nr:hypothetical protein F5X99DRAFT_41078 [Biscogniauxia marginata]
MATNSGRGNPIGTTDGPSKTGEGAPPPVSADVKGALREATKGVGAGAGSGSHAAGQDAGVAASRAEKADPKVEVPPATAAADRDSGSRSEEWRDGVRREE